MIDWDRVRSLIDDIGKDDFSEVTELFFSELGGALARLHDHSDPQVLAEQLHFLRGGASNLGFTDFVALCQAGETALPDPLDVDALTESFLAAHVAFQREIPAVLKQAAPDQTNL